MPDYRKKGATQTHHPCRHCQHRKHRDERSRKTNEKTTRKFLDTKRLQTVSKVRSGNRWLRAAFPSELASESANESAAMGVLDPSPLTMVPPDARARLKYFGDYELLE